jgi:hypothetical protein
MTDTQITSTSTLKSLRFNLPIDCLNGIARIKMIGQDVLVYVENDNFDSVKKSYIDHGFKFVEREYKVHVSAQSKEEFEKLFEKVKYEDRSSEGRFIATITASSEEEYNKYLTIGTDPSNNCHVKPFKAGIANIHKKNDIETTPPPITTNKPKHIYNTKPNHKFVTHKHE